MKASKFIKLLEENQLNFFATVPCSITSKLHELLSLQENIKLHTTYHEHNLAGMATGYYLATGKTPVIHMQNSGFPNALDGLLTCIKLYEIPVLVLVTWRGDTPNDISEPHQLIGDITQDLTSSLGFGLFGQRDGSNFEEEAEKAIESIKQGIPAILRIASQAFDDESSEFSIDKTQIGTKQEKRDLEKVDLGSREEAIKSVVSKHDPSKTVFIFSNGYTSRAAIAISDGDKNFYNIGYMGGSMAIGHTLSIYRPDLEIVVIDGDQNAEMSCMKDHLFHHYPKNLHYYIIDNGIGASVKSTRSIPLAEYYGEIADLINIPPDTSEFRYPRVKFKEGLPALVARLRSSII